MSTLEQLKLRPEHELVLNCARTQADAQTIARIRALMHGSIDWDYLYSFAQRHSVVSLVYRQLNTIAPASVPSEQLNRLKDYYQKNSGRNLFLTGELERILRSFQNEGIEAIPYKGPALAVTAYGDLRLRRFVDLDIMVRRTDVLRAKELLIELGYRCGTDWSRSQEALLMRTQHNLSLSRENGRLIVELHWEVAPDLYAPSFQAEQLWQRLASLKLRIFTVKSLAPEDLFLSICVHGSKHLWSRLAWICDVAEMLRSRPNLDWETLCRQARSTGTENMMFLGLYLAQILFQASVPKNLRSGISSHKAVSALGSEVMNLLFSVEEKIPTLRRTFLFNIRLREDWRSRLRYCRLLLKPTDGDLRTVALPRFLNFAYYVMRPFRLLRANQRPVG